MAETVGWQFDAVSLGYPGKVTETGPAAEPGDLGNGWVAFDFEAHFGCPVRVVNDAVMQALGGYRGRRMLFLGLGTGLGSALVIERVVVPPSSVAGLAVRWGRPFQYRPALRGV
jgi:predicted NBD/HSP70 family sugar kinase